MKFKYIALGMALASTLSIGSSTAVQASDITDLLRGYLGVNANSGIFARNQATIQNNINTGLVDLSSKISAGVSSGQLTAEEHSMLNADLDRLRSMHSSFMADGGYTEAEVQSMLNSFSSFNATMAANLSNSNVAGGFGSTYNFGGNGYGRGWGGGRFNQNLTTRAQVDDMMARIRTQISTGRANGSLTRFEANSLRQELDRIAADFNQRTWRGNFRGNPIVQRLISLDNRVDALSTNRQTAGTSRYWR